MTKVIIGIHGLGNKPTKEILEDWWRQAMMEGLEDMKKPFDLPEFALVYWSDILHKQPLDENILEEDNPLHLQEKYVHGLANIEPEENSLRQKVLDFLEEQLDKLFLNEDLTINYSGISDAIIHRYFSDLEFYYTEECLDKNNVKCTARSLIRGRLVEVLEMYKDDEIMLIGHSMGSIIAYDVLTFLMPDIKIHTFVTIGSPLGFPVVQGKIASEWNSKRLVPPKLKTPPGVKKHWYNFADLKDKVALIYQLGKNFHPNYRGVKVKDFIVQNDYQIEGNANHHKSYGYLRTKEFSAALLKFSHRKNILINLFSKVFK